MSSTYTAPEGEYFPADRPGADALNQNINVAVEGQAGRYDWVRLMDLRVSKVVTRSAAIRWRACSTCFNMSNSSVVLSQVNINGPNYLKPLPTGSGAATAEAIPAPRIFRVTARWTF